MKNFLTVGLLFFAFMVSAQQGGGQGGGQRQGGGFQSTPEQREQQYQRMKTELNLNDKQFADYKKIAEETYTKQQAMRQNAGGGGAADREAITKLRDEQNAKIKAALTADQYKKYEELQTQRGQGGGPGGGQGGGQRQGGGGNRQN